MVTEARARGLDVTMYSGVSDSADAWMPATDFDADDAHHASLSGFDYVPAADVFGHAQPGAQLLPRSQESVTHFAPVFSAP
ncbi:hypothetical protein EGI20_02430, partial [Aquitalea sp. S1-19]|nr:hypothetical protein [Aquitalea sp. S1-19]